MKNLLWKRALSNPRHALIGPLSTYELKAVVSQRKIGVEAFKECIRCLRCGLKAYHDAGCLGKMMRS